VGQIVLALWGSQSWLQPAFSRLSSDRSVSAARDAPGSPRLLRGQSLIALDSNEKLAPGIYIHDEAHSDTQQIVLFIQEELSEVIRRINNAAVLV
jgi:hypothetical protein